MAWWKQSGSNEGKKQDYSEVVTKTAAMVRDGAAQALVQRHGLQILGLTWQDTGRYKGSSVGPNISDMTIQVTHGEHKTPTCMPVIRFPNFSDKTGDIPLDVFTVLVGNERGQSLRKVALRQILTDLRAYLHTPAS